MFHRMTKSKTSGGKNNWKIEPNPIKDCYFTFCMIKKEETANKRKFSKEKVKIKKGRDASFPGIKRAKKKWPCGHYCLVRGSTQLNGANISVLTYEWRQHNLMAYTITRKSYFIKASNGFVSVLGADATFHQHKQANVPQINVQQSQSLLNY